MVSRHAASNVQSPPLPLAGGARSCRGSHSLSLSLSGTTACVELVRSAVHRARPVEGDAGKSLGMPWSFSASCFCNAVSCCFPSDFQRFCFLLVFVPAHRFRHVCDGLPRCLCTCKPGAVFMKEGRTGRGGIAMSADSPGDRIAAAAPMSVRGATEEDTNHGDEAMTRM